MGQCCSDCTIPTGDVEQLRRDIKISKDIHVHKRSDKGKIKLLLLGAGESGKSTIFKQFRKLYGDPKTSYNQQNRFQQFYNIHTCIIKNMKCLLSFAKQTGEFLEQNQTNLTSILNFPEQEPACVITPEIASLLLELWNDPLTKLAWKNRSKNGVSDSLRYFIENIQRISATDYIPSFDDILRIRIKTVGIVEDSYYIDGVNFVVFDVGGQNNERRKWIHCFEKVTAVLYIAAVNEYNKYSIINGTKYNCLAQSVTLFEEICNCVWFKDTSMILFLNKDDLLRENLVDYPFSLKEGDDIRFPGFSYSKQNLLENDQGRVNETEFDEYYRAVIEYIVLLFQKKNAQYREIYHHVTCATNTENIRFVFYSCKDILLRRLLIQEVS